MLLGLVSLLSVCVAFCVFIAICCSWLKECEKSRLKRRGAGGLAGRWALKPLSGQSGQFGGRFSVFPERTSPTSWFRGAWLTSSMWWAAKFWRRKGAKEFSSFLVTLMKYLRQANFTRKKVYWAHSGGSSRTQLCWGLHDGWHNSMWEEEILSPNRKPERLRSAVHSQGTPPVDLQSSHGVPFLKGPTSQHHSTEAHVSKTQTMRDTCKPHRNYSRISWFRVHTFI